MRLAALRLPTGLPKEAYKTGKTIRGVAREQTDLSDEELEEVLDARQMTGS